MCKLVEDYGNERAKEAANKAAKEERRNNIKALLNKGMSAEWIHDTLNVPIKLIEQIQSSLTIKK